MTIIAIFACLLIVIGMVFLLFLQRQSRSYGILTNKKIYQDTQENPGEILTSKKIPLRGKPDYIVQTKDAIIPVEVKTGKTPTYPYDSHIMQLMAYCYLIEELYGSRPPGGYIRYNEKQFQIAYTDEAKGSLENIVNEIMLCKERGEEFLCQHPYHYEN